MSKVAYLAVDLETTGLEETGDFILEVAWAPLTATFEQLEPTKSFVVEMTPAARERIMANEYTKSMHQANGLIKDSLEGGLPLSLIESVIQTSLDQHEWAAPQLTIFGSSVHFDLRFTQAHMPNLAKWLHYRVFDVTTLLSFGDAAGVPREENRTIAHRAAADIDWSIATAQRLLGALRVQQGVNA